MLCCVCVSVWLARDPSQVEDAELHDSGWDPRASGLTDSVGDESEEVEEDSGNAVVLGDDGYDSMDVEQQD